MKAPKVNRSQSRETALQILYCQHLHDGEMARAVSAVEATKTIADLREAIKMLQTSRGATERVITAFEDTIGALTELLKPTGDRKPLKPLKDGTLDTTADLATARKEALMTAREAIQMMQTHEALFHSDGFAHRLLKTYEKHKEEIHVAIDQSLDGWTLRRLIAEDSAMLRLGATEILFFADIPPKATINEYVELSKNYGDKESPRLINAVLDRLLQDHPRPEKTHV